MVKMLYFTLLKVFSQCKSYLTRTSSINPTVR